MDNICLSVYAASAIANGLVSTQLRVWHASCCYLPRAVLASYGKSNRAASQSHVNGLEFFLAWYARHVSCRHVT